MPLIFALIIFIHSPLSFSCKDLINPSVIAKAEELGFILRPIPINDFISKFGPPLGYGDEKIIYTLNGSKDPDVDSAIKALQKKGEYFTISESSKFRYATGKVGDYIFTSFSHLLSSDYIQKEIILNLKFENLRASQPDANDYNENLQWISKGFKLHKVEHSIYYDPILQKKVIQITPVKNSTQPINRLAYYSEKMYKTKIYYLKSNAKEFTLAFYDPYKNEIQSRFEKAKYRSFINDEVRTIKHELRHAQFEFKEDSLFRTRIYNRMRKLQRLSSRNYSNYLSLEELYNHFEDYYQDFFFDKIYMRAPVLLKERLDFYRGILNRAQSSVNKLYQSKSFFLKSKRDNAVLYRHFNPLIFNDVIILNTHKNLSNTQTLELLNSFLTELKIEVEELSHLVQVNDQSIFFKYDTNDEIYKKVEAKMKVIYQLLKKYR